MEVLNKTTKPMVKTISLGCKMFKTFCISMLQKIVPASLSGIYED